MPNDDRYHCDCGHIIYDDLFYCPCCVELTGTNTEWGDEDEFDDEP